MTIFLEIMKDLLIPRVKIVRDKSFKADESNFNTLLSWVGKGRNPELSQFKRNRADKLWVKLEKLTDQRNLAQEIDDVKTHEKIRILLDKCKEKAAEESKRLHYPDEGKFGPRMQKLIDLTDALFKIFQKHNLLNVAHDDDPLNSLRFFIAFYIAQKEVDVRELGALGKLVQNPKITDIKKIAEEKEALALKILKECEEDLETLDKEHPSYSASRRKCVVNHINELMRQNKALCKQHGLKYNIPMTLSFFTALNISLPSLRPGPGFLDECADNALKEVIEKTPAMPESSNILALLTTNLEAVPPIRIKKKENEKIVEKMVDEPKQKDKTLKLTKQGREMEESEELEERDKETSLNP